MYLLGLNQKLFHLHNLLLYHLLPFLDCSIQNQLLLKYVHRLLRRVLLRPAFPGLVLPRFAQLPQG